MSFIHQYSLKTEKNPKLASFVAQFWPGSHLPITFLLMSFAQLMGETS